jgi:hypothetical protein
VWLPLSLCHNPSIVSQREENPATSGLRRVFSPTSCLRAFVPQSLWLRPSRAARLRLPSPPGQPELRPWGDSGVALRSIGGRSGDDLGSVWGRFGAAFSALRPPCRNRNPFHINHLPHNRPRHPRPIRLFSSPVPPPHWQLATNNWQLRTINYQLPTINQPNVP